MARMRCPLSGEEYNENDFLGLIHKYLAVDTELELEGIKSEMFNNQQWLQQLTQRSNHLVLSELVPHFKERCLTAPSEEFLGLEFHKWNWIGFLLARLQSSKSSVELYRALYTLLCERQEDKKQRIHKGLPLHQIGWTYLLQGGPESIKASQFYMKLALIEDKLKSSNDDSYKQWPAYSVLRSEHRLTETYLNRIVDAVRRFKHEYPDDPCMRPELIYLEHVIDRMNHERSSLYDLDPLLAGQLLDRVKTAASNNAKGSSLEMLLAYLFLTCPGFEVVRNLTTFDAQIDLLIRNLQIADPIFEEFGKYILVECRNLKEKVEAKAIREFATKVIQAACSSGVLIAKTGYTGDKEKQAARDARMAILKVQQRHNVVIVPITLEQLEPVVQKEISLLDLLVHEYEKIRFDLV